MPDWTYWLIALFWILSVYLLNHYWQKKLNKAIEETKKIGMKKVTSLAVNHGFVAEQWFPISLFNTFKNYEMHYMGKPIDYVAFGDNEIVFIELKTGESQLSTKQRDIKQTIENGNVKFVTIRMENVNANNGG
jgi:predicted Holliday junction resolvase-like endonuclease